MSGSRRLFLGLVCEIFNSVRQGEFERFQFHLFICILFFWRGLYFVVGYS